MGINNKINSNPQTQPDDNNSNDSMVQIPGIFELTGKSSIPPSLFLLVGLTATGKSVYCRQFFIDGIQHADFCIYISPGMTEKKFRTLFPTIEAATLDMASKFINPYMRRDTKNNKGNTDDDSDKLKLTLSELHEILVNQKRENEQNNNNLENDENKESSSLSYKAPSSSPFGKSKSIRVVVDSLTQLLVLFGESAVLKFVGELSLLLKEFEATAIFTLTGSLIQPNSLTNAVSSMVDGILEMRLEEGKDASLARSIRMVSINGI
ncbi:MAG TPA: hypothetical protein VJ799_11020, partial [Nitrososphaeraceae archaeon]|nr:hypothetical protein [Nitrososphaeraceae archaeon]